MIDTDDPQHWLGDAGDLGRYCRPCQIRRHGDCRPHGCSAQRDDQ